MTTLELFLRRLTLSELRQLNIALTDVSLALLRNIPIEHYSQFLNSIFWQQLTYFTQWVRIELSRREVLLTWANIPYAEVLSSTTLK